MKRTMQIKPAEGGEDSKLFMHDLADAYVRLASSFG
jgi:protein subunit release factor A